MLLRNKYDLKKQGDFTVSEGHKYPLVYIYNHIEDHIIKEGCLFVCFVLLKYPLHSILEIGYLIFLESI
jgi:hypothetical protein